LLLKFKFCTLFNDISYTDYLLAFNTFFIIIYLLIRCSGVIKIKSYLLYEIVDKIDR